MLTIRQYNKIMHDWIVLLTGLSGSNVRPQKNKYSFDLTDSQGRPLSFDGLVSMFYFGFEDEAIDRSFGDDDSATQLKRASINVTFIGDGCDQLANQFQATSLGVTSRSYLNEYGFTIFGNPNEIITDKEFSSKWFYRRTVQINLNCSLDFVPAPGSVLDQIVEDVPLYINAKQLQAPTDILWGNIKGYIENQTDLIDYIAQNGGKIDSITFKDQVLPIVNKNVALPDNLAITDGNNNFLGPQTFNGDVTINGNITQIGESYETHAEQVYTKDDTIILRDGSTGGLGQNQFAGFIAKNYDGQNDGALVYDASGTAYIGDVTTDENDNITDTSNLQPLATRDKSSNLIEGQLMTWNAAQQKLVGSNKDDVVTDGLLNNSNDLTIQQKTQILDWLGITGMSQSEWDNFSNFTDGQYYFVWED